MATENLDKAKMIAKRWTLGTIELYDAYLQVKDGKEARVGDRVFRTVEEIVDRCLERGLILYVCSDARWAYDRWAIKIPFAYIAMIESEGPFVRLTGELDSDYKPITARVEIANHGIPWREWKKKNKDPKTTDALLWFAHVLLCDDEFPSKYDIPDDDKAWKWWLI